MSPHILGDLLQLQSLICYAHIIELGHEITTINWEYLIRHRLGQGHHLRVDVILEHPQPRRGIRLCSVHVQHVRQARRQDSEYLLSGELPSEEELHVLLTQRGGYPVHISAYTIQQHQLSFGAAVFLFYALLRPLELGLAHQVTKGQDAGWFGVIDGVVVGAVFLGRPVPFSYDSQGLYGRESDESVTGMETPEMHDLPGR